MNGVLVRKQPPRRPAACHAQSADHLRVLAQSIRQKLPLSIALCRYFGCASRSIFGQQCHGDDGGGPARRSNADRRMKEEQWN